MAPAPLAPSAPPADRRRSGLATALFSLIALSFGLIGAGQLLAAGQTWRREKGEFERWRAELVLEGVANRALAGLLVNAGDGPFAGEFADGASRYAVRLDREDEKQSLFQSATPLPAALTVAVRAALAAPPAGRTRALVAALNGEPAACAFTTTSPVAGGAASLAPRRPLPLGEQGEVDWRAGQRWRISVMRPDGLVLERWVLLSGKASQPALELARALHRVAPERWRTCNQDIAA